MRVSAKIANQDASILIDTGAELNHISSSFCSRFNIPTEPSNQRCILADKTIKNLGVTRDRITVQIKGYTENMKFVVADIYKM